jgi:hypothetical protein
VESVGVALQRHVTGALVISMMLFVAGACVLLQRLRRKDITSIAKSRGVQVGRNNSGTINTGDVARAKAEPSSGDWIAITGVIVAILGVIIAVLAWWLPRSPSSP